MQSVSSKIWTRVVVSISYDDNHYTTGTSLILIGKTLEGKSFLKLFGILFIQIFRGKSNIVVCKS